MTSLIFFPPLFTLETFNVSDFLIRVAIFGLIVLLTFVIAKGLGILVYKALSRTNQNLGRQAKSFVTWLIWLIGILVGLGELGVDLTILLVIVALTGVFLLYAFRDILANAGAYEAISIYKPFKIGDWIQIEKSFGRVIDITYMDTVLMTPDNETVYIPNHKMTQNKVINRTTLGGIRISIPIKLKSNINLSKVEGILLEIGNELKEELAADSKPEVRVTEITQDTVSIALLLRINNPAKGKLIASEVRKRAKDRLDKLRIKQ